MSAWRFNAGLACASLMLMPGSAALAADPILATDLLGCWIEATPEGADATRHLCFADDGTLETAVFYAPELEGLSTIGKFLLGGGKIAFVVQGSSDGWPWAQESLYCDIALDEAGLDLTKCGDEGMDLHFDHG